MEEINSIKAIIRGESLNKLSDEHMYSTKDIEFYKDKVVLNGQIYEKLFKKLRKDESKPWRKGKVKITYNNKEIIRVFKGSSYESVSVNQIGLTIESLSMLGIDFRDYLKTGKIQIAIKKGNIFKFLWNHPDIYVRVAYKIGLIGVAISVLSILLTLAFGLNII